MNSSTPDSGAHSLDGGPFLSSLSSKECGEVERHCQFQEYGANEKIIQKGDDVKDVFYLLAGKACVLNYSESGRAVSYATFGEGDFSMNSQPLMVFPAPRGSGRHHPAPW